jgi:hypothetical protein
LEASFIAFRLPSYHGNISKRLIKMPKLHFYDTGPACWLPGIREAAQLDAHPLRGAIFECWVVSEIIKQRFNWGEGNMQFGKSLTPRVRFDFGERTSRFRIGMRGSAPSLNPLPNVSDAGVADHTRGRVCSPKTLPMVAVSRSPGPRKLVFIGLTRLAARAMLAHVVARHSTPGTGKPRHWLAAGRINESAIYH